MKTLLLLVLTFSSYSFAGGICRNGDDAAGLAGHKTQYNCSNYLNPTDCRLDSNGMCYWVLVSNTKSSRYINYAGLKYECPIEIKWLFLGN